MINFKNTVTGSGSNTLTTVDGNSQFDGAISNLTTLTTAGTATFNTNVTFNNIGTLSTQKAEINCTAITKEIRLIMI